MRLHQRAIALGLVIALGLPVVIGTVVVIRRAFDDSGRSSSVVSEPFDTIAFRVGDDPTTRCALLAASEAARRQGMQGMSDLRGYDAMVFQFAQDTQTSFINHFVPIDLSIGWYDATGRLVDHTTMEACPEGKDCATYAARDPYRYAVETPLGGLDRLGLTQTGAVLQVGGSC